MCCRDAFWRIFWGRSLNSQRHLCLWTQLTNPLPNLPADWLAGVLSVCVCGWMTDSGCLATCPPPPFSPPLPYRFIHTCSWWVALNLGTTNTTSSPPPVCVCCLSFVSVCLWVWLAAPLIGPCSLSIVSANYNEAEKPPDLIISGLKQTN